MISHIVYMTPDGKERFDTSAEHEDWGSHWKHLNHCWRSAIDPWNQDFALVLLSHHQITRTELSRKGLKMNSVILEVLEDVANRLHRFCETDNVMVGVDEEPRKAVNPYISSWCLLPLRAAIDEISRETNRGEHLKGTF